MARGGGMMRESRHLFIAIAEADRQRREGLRLRERESAARARVALEAELPAARLKDWKAVLPMKGTI